MVKNGTQVVEQWDLHHSTGMLVTWEHKFIQKDTQTHTHTHSSMRFRGGE